MNLKAPERAQLKKKTPAKSMPSASTNNFNVPDGAAESVSQSQVPGQSIVDRDAAARIEPPSLQPPSHVPPVDLEPPTVKSEPNCEEVTIVPTSTACLDPLAHQFADPVPQQHSFPHQISPKKDNIPTAPLESPAKTARTRQKVHIRRTSQGWLEFDKDKETKVNNEGSRKDDIHANDANDLDGKLSASEADAPEKVTGMYSPQASTQAQWQAFADVIEPFVISTEDNETLLSYFSPAVVDAIRSLYNRATDPSHRNFKESGVVRSAAIDRQVRTKIHQDIRRIFNSRLESTTEHDGTMIISAMPKAPAYSSKSTANSDSRNNNRNNGKRSGRKDDWSQGQSFRSKPGWQELGGEYLHFTLYKENKDTMEAISWLSKKLQTNARSFQFAGTKDRRAVTVQRVSVYRTYIQKLISAGWTLRNAKIGDYVYQPHALQLGELDGNEFVITLRECDFRHPQDADLKTRVEGAQFTVGNAIRNLCERGFINYYGLQRFGTFSISTDIVGLKMLQGDFKGAVEAILHFDPNSLAAARDQDSSSNKMSRDDAARAHVIHSFQMGSKVASVIDDMPRRFSAESAIIRHLGRSNQINDNMGALKQISRPLRLMYVHAYQSLVWNMAASERWKRYGTLVVDGDLVLVDEHDRNFNIKKETEDLDQDGEAVVRPSEDDRANNEGDLFVRARALSKDEAASGRYTIFDVVLPTPGFDIIYPPNEMGKFYETFMASERGGGLNPHDMRRNWKDISLSGSYRKLLAKPGNVMKYEVKMYDRDDEQFVETDAERLERNKGVQFFGSNIKDKVNVKSEDSEVVGDLATKAQENVEQASTEMDGGPIDKVSSSETDRNGGVRLDLDSQPKTEKKIAVVLTIQLGASQYATMALRELMKQGGAKPYKPDLGEGR